MAFAATAVCSRRGCGFVFRVRAALVGARITRRWRSPASLGRDYCRPADELVVVVVAALPSAAAHLLLPSWVRQGDATSSALADSLCGDDRSEIVPPLPCRHRRPLPCRHRRPRGDGAANSVVPDVSTWSREKFLRSTTPRQPPSRTISAETSPTTVALKPPRQLLG